jgi:GNAT superfamily N-acetyltransferase
MDQKDKFRDKNAKPLVREADVRDIQDILLLYEQLFSNTDQAEINRAAKIREHTKALFEIKQNQNHHLLVAEIEGMVVGTLAIIIIPNLSHMGRPWAIVEDVIVDESHRGLGIGSLLMQRAIQLAKERDCFRVILASSKQRDESHKFYESLGLEAYGYSFKVHL